MVTFRVFIAIGLIGSLGACASVTQDKTQPVKVETLDQSGNKVVGAKCELQNDRGAYNVETPNTVFVRKSGGDLIITCNAEDQDQADAKLISRAGGAVFGNIILGGVIGAVVDTARGVAFNYPEWVQLVFGKTLIFDRHDFKAAQPSMAKVVPADAGAEAEIAAASSAKEGGDTASTEPKIEYITIIAADNEGDVTQ